MGKIYDDWGILVKAVLRREHDRELAMCHSRDPSFISNDDGSSCRFSFDSTTPFSNQSPKTTIILGMDYSYQWDTTSPLDHVAMARIEGGICDVFSCHSTSSVELMDELIKSQFTSDEIIVIMDSFDSIYKLHLIPAIAIYDLRCIAERMEAEGFLREYVQVFAGVRKSFIDVSLKKLNVEELSIGDIEKLEWETLRTNIWRWTKVAKMSVRVLFASERRLCNKLFEGLGDETSAEGVCFMETVKDSAIQLFNFADAVSISKQSPERLFKILVLHNTLSELLPDIESVFDSEFGEPIRLWVVEILYKLVEAARGILLEFENSVLHEPSIVPVPGGTIHPLTKYVMNYVSFISDFKLTLLGLIVSGPSTALSTYSTDPNMSDFNLAAFKGDGSTLALHLIWIMVILQLNLSGKSKHYKDDSLAHLFMMNSIHYIRQKIMLSPELSEMIGGDYLRSLNQKFISAATYYERATWSRLLHCLRIEGLHVSSGDFSIRVSKSVLRERFKSFNAIFEKVRRTQAMWLIPDIQLREELRISITEKLIPSYRSFYLRFRGLIDNGNNPKKYITYSFEDLEKSLFEDFFKGSPVSRYLRKTKCDESN